MTLKEIKISNACNRFLKELELLHVTYGEILNILAQMKETVVTEIKEIENEVNKQLKGPDNADS